MLPHAFTKPYLIKYGRYRPQTHHHTISIPEESQSKSHRHHRNRPLNYWGVIKLPDGSKKAYQFSKDIQFAINHDGPQIAIPQLIGNLIVIPISDYHYGQVHMTIGQIEFVFKQPHTSNARWITRGQMTQIHLKNGQPQYRIMANYLKHDYNAKSQATIKHAIKQLVPNYSHIGTKASLWIVMVNIIIFITMKLMNHETPVTPTIITLAIGALIEMIIIDYYIIDSATVTNPKNYLTKQSQTKSKLKSWKVEHYGKLN